MLLVLSPRDVQRIGLNILGIEFRSGTSNEAKRKEFKKHYGSSPNVLATQWEDLQQVDGAEVKMDKKDKRLKGFYMFLIAHAYLWSYHRNSSKLAQEFKLVLNRRNAYGEPIWRWIDIIAGLCKTKIVWDKDLDDPNTERFIVSVDGVDFEIWEKKHRLFNQNKKMCSKKHNGAGLKYEIAMSTFKSKCVWIRGPFRGGKHDISIYRGDENEEDAEIRHELGLPPYEALQDKIKPGKYVNADRGYQSGKGIAPPNPSDPKDLAKFKSRGRARHETFNGRLKFYGVLRDCFRHGLHKHKSAFEAVAVTVQYQMDAGGEVFAM